MSKSNGQWGWKELELLLQCPICLEPPSSGFVEQCFSGHHVCSSCKPKLDSCPLCKKRYEGTRNYVVEELMCHFEILKNTMLLYSIDDEKDKVEVKKCLVDIKPKEKRLSTPNATRGVYPCGIRNCDVKLPACRILNHVRCFHRKALIECKLNERGVFNIYWMLNSVKRNNIFVWQKALFISGIGLVFFNYELLPGGFALISCQMVAQLKVTKNYKVKISVHSTNTTNQYSLTTKLLSTRENMENLIPKKACMVLDERSLKAISENKQFKCSLEFSVCNGTEVFSNSVPMFPLSTGIIAVYKYLLENLKALPLPTQSDGIKRKGRRRTDC